MFVRILTVAVAALSLVACDDPSSSAETGALDLTLEVPNWATYEPSPSPAMADVRFDAERSVTRVWTRAPSVERPSVARVDRYDFRSVDHGRARLPAEYDPRAAVDPPAEAIPELGVPMPQPIVILPTPATERLDAACQEQCAGAGARSMNRLISLDDQLACLCRLPADAELRCARVALNVTWTDRTGAPLGTEKTPGYRCD